MPRNERAPADSYWPQTACFHCWRRPLFQAVLSKLMIPRTYRTSFRCVWPVVSRTLFQLTASTVDSRKLQYGCRVIYAGFPSFFCFRIKAGSVPTFWLLVYNPVSLGACWPSAPDCVKRVVRNLNPQPNAIRPTPALPKERS